MFWPRMKLTPGEERMNQVKYFDHERGARGVLRKIYGGFLTLTSTIRAPVFNFGISRRCRVFGLTASGDIAQFKIQLQDSSGENYLADPVSMPSLLGGYVEMPPASYGDLTAGSQGGFPPVVNDAAAGNDLGWAAAIGAPKTYAPLIFEPNIVLSPNQNLTVNGFPMAGYATIDYRVDLCFHVWEFPGWKTGAA